VRNALLGIAIAAAAAAGLYSATLAGAATECEACMAYGGREACRSATGADREEAERTAIATACALVADGVTATINCQGLEPVKLECRVR
jgi:hypothetical protein